MSVERVHHQEFSLRSISVPLLVGVLAASLASCGKRETKAAERAPAEASVNSEQKTFELPDAAGAALFEAAKTGNQDQLKAIFGPEGKDFAYTGDAEKDKESMKQFTDAYTRMHRWDKRKSGDQLLLVGAENVAFPVPLSKNSSDKWVFNTAAGKDEILARRIGDGELTATGVLTEIANAQHEFFTQNHQYATKFVSDEGQRNGLYWRTAEGQRPSPLGAFPDIAKSLSNSESKPQAFSGYYYKMSAQGNDAFTVVARPVKYGDSGIMSFIVGKDGVVYQKDLGQKTNDAAGAITAYSPNQGWSVVLAPESPDAAVGARNAKK
ncbi:MAG TPA: DUF2950 family protein [Candidatus Angelobacter sp.]